MANTLYPAKAYASASSRAAAFAGEFFFDCNAEAILRAYSARGSPSYGYEFSVSSVLPLPAGYHTEDLVYTYYNGFDKDSDLSNATIAKDFQTYLVNFAVHGNPNSFPASVKLPKIPVWGKQHQLLNFTDTGYTVVSDPLAKGIGQKKCGFFDEL